MKFKKINLIFIIFSFLLIVVYSHSRKSHKKSHVIQKEIKKNPEKKIKVIGIKVSNIFDTNEVTVGTRKDNDTQTFELPEIIKKQQLSKQIKKKQTFSSSFPIKKMYFGDKFRISSRSFKYQNINKKLLLEGKNKYEKAIALYDSAEMELFEQSCKELIRDYHHLEVAADAAYAIAHFEYSIGNFETSKIYFLYILNNHYNAKCSAKALHELAQVLISDYYFDEGIRLLMYVINDKKKVDEVTFIKTWKYLQDELFLKIRQKKNRKFIVLKK